MDKVSAGVALVRGRWYAALTLSDGHGHRRRIVGEARFRTAASAKFHADQWANAWRDGADEFIGVERASNG